MKRNWRGQLSRVLVFLLIVSILSGSLSLNYRISAAAPATRFEAEAAILGGGAKVFSDMAEASGNSLVGDMRTVGSYVRFDNLPTSSSVGICYASPHSGTISIYLNDIHVHDAAFITTGGWFGEGCYNTIWLDIKINSGDSLKIQYDNGDARVNVDYIECVSSFTRFEAEGAVTTFTTTYTGIAGASGNAIVGNLNSTGSYLTFNNVPEATSIDICYASPESGKISIYHNDIDLMDMEFTSTGAWHGVGYFGTIRLNITTKRGDSLRIRFDSGDTAVNIDYIDFYPPSFTQGTNTRIAAGPNHTVMVDSDDTVWTWGNNEDGQLGIGGTTSSSSPTQLSELVDIAEVSAGGDTFLSVYHSAALKLDGTVWTWGDNSYGQLGNGTQTASSVPVKLTSLTSVTSVSCGGTHMVALKSDGTVWTWGRNQYGQLGNGMTVDSSAPVQVGGLGDIVKVAAGGYHTVAVKSDGTVWTWGYNSNGQLGNSTTVNSSIPVQVSGLSGAASVAAGYRHTVAVKSEGTVWTWGYNYYGQLGNNSNVNSFVPVIVKGLGDVMAVSSGYYHTLALKSDGSVWTWGNNTQGRLGNGGQTHSYLPVQVSILENVIAIAGGATHSTVMKKDSRVCSWGNNEAGQLGIGTTTGSPLPVPAIPIERFPLLTTPATAIMPAPGIKSVAAGTQHMLHVNADGTVWAWGANSKGELGSGQTGVSFIRTPVQAIGLTGIVAVEGGGSGNYAHSVALKSDGTVWTWGYNLYGQLGDGTMENTAVPVKVKELTGIVAVAAGGNNTAALKADGSVFLWGQMNGSLVPLKVDSLTDIVAIEGGNTHIVALKSDGTVWVWGSNATGQFGNGTTTDSSIPVQAGNGMTGVAVIEAGNNFTMVIKSNGTVWAWGNNAYGQLGNGTRTNSLLPIQIEGLSDIISIAAQNTQNAAVRSDGSVWAWGFNGYSIAGDGIFNSSYILKPVKVREIHNALDVDAGLLALIVLTLDGNIWTWGGNTYGQLGNGLSGSSNIPYKVGSMPFNLAVPPIPKANNCSVAAGSGYTVELKDDGTVWAWGSNSDGQLGNGTTLDSAVPVQIETLTDIAAISADSTGALTAALKSDGTVFTWGNGSSVPVQTDTLANVAAIAAGKSHMAVLKTDGTVFTWGDNGQGQLGNGSTTSSPSPVQVSSLAGIAAIACGETHTVALKSDGTVWVWGNGSTAPVQVPSLSEVTAIAAGASFTAAIKSDGSIWTWGDNTYGQLGNGTSTSSLVPVEVSGLVHAIAVACGTNHAAAVKSDGTVWTWGSNSGGQLGDGTTADSTLPVHADSVSSIVRIECADLHTAAQKYDGTVFILNAETLIDTTAPEAPAIIPAVTDFTNTGFEVEITASEDEVLIEYKIDDGDWSTYSAPITVSQNCTVYARCSDAAENMSDISELIIANFVHKGDVNFNGVVRSSDALMALQHSAGVNEICPETAPVKFWAADVNDSSTVTSVDALKILQFSAEVITSFRGAIL